MSRGRSRSQRNGDASSEEVELEAAENLLSRLKRQYRMMERNRRQYYDETTLLLDKQRKMLLDLEQEKSKLEEETKLLSNPKNLSRDDSTRNAMSAILERQEQYENLIEEEKDKIKELEATITSLEKQLRETRRKLPSLKLLEEEREAAQVANVTLENRIQQATVRLNGILSENSTLRENIDNLLKERDKFLIQARRLEKQLAMTSKKKSDIMDQVTKAYTEREEAQSKMRSLKERINRDTLKYTNEMKKIQRAIDYQISLRSFVNTISIGEEEETYKKKQEGEVLDEGGIEMTLENFRASISHLEESSQESSVDNLISNYLQADNDNYTLFSYISDLNNEVTAISSDVARLQQEIDDVQGKGSQTERENNNALGNLREELYKTQSQVSSLEEEDKRAKEVLSEIMEAVSEMFDVLECDPKPIHALIGGFEVSSSNLSVFLSVIEQKIQEICLLRDSLKAKSDDLLSPRQTQSVNEVNNDGQSGSDLQSSVTKAKPAIPHIAHPSDDDATGPITHSDLLSSLRLRWSDSLEV